MTLYIKWLKMKEANKTQNPEKKTVSEPSKSTRTTRLREFLTQAKK